jgi:hypothetical protein
VNVRFACPVCDHPARVRLPGAVDWQCPACDHRLRLDAHAAGETLATCAVCGNGELYKKKAFPHALGLAILTAACVASVFTYAWYQKWLTWAILIGSAVFDGLLYLWVGDAVVCYRCGAEYHKLEPGPQHRPFELSIGERYRQERLRREQLQAEKRSGPPA